MERRARSSFFSHSLFLTSPYLSLTLSLSLFSPSLSLSLRRGKCPCGSFFLFFLFWLVIVSFFLKKVKVFLFPAPERRGRQHDSPPRSIFCKKSRSRFLSQRWLILIIRVCVVWFCLSLSHSLSLSLSLSHSLSQNSFSQNSKLSLQAQTRISFLSLSPQTLAVLSRRSFFLEKTRRTKSTGKIKTRCCFLWWLVREKEREAAPGKGRRRRKIKISLSLSSQPLPHQRSPLPLALCDGCLCWYTR